MVYAFLLLEDGSSPCGRFVGPIELPSPCAWIDRDPDPRPVWLPPIRFEDGQRELVGLDVWCVGAGCAPDLSQFGDDDGDEKAKP